MPFDAAEQERDSLLGRELLEPLVRCVAARRPRPAPRARAATVSMSIGLASSAEARAARAARAAGSSCPPCARRWSRARPRTPAGSSSPCSRANAVTNASCTRSSTSASRPIKRKARPLTIGACLPEERLLRPRLARARREHEGRVARAAHGSGWLGQERARARPPCIEGTAAPPKWLREPFSQSTALRGEPFAVAVVPTCRTEMRPANRCRRVRPRSPRRARPGGAAPPRSRCARSPPAPTRAARPRLRPAGPALARESAEYCAGQRPAGARRQRRGRRSRLDVSRPAGAAGVPVCALYVQQLRQRSRALVTDAFDGAKGPYDPSTATAGGSVGVNGDLHPTGAHADRRLALGEQPRRRSRPRPSRSPASCTRRANCALRPSSASRRDAWMASGIQTSGDVTVAARCTCRASRRPPVVTGMYSHGAIGTWPSGGAGVRLRFSHVVDVAGVVDLREAERRRTRSGIAPTMLANVQSRSHARRLAVRAHLPHPDRRQPASIHLTAAGPGRPLRRRETSRRRTSSSTCPPGASSISSWRDNLTVRGVFQIGDPDEPGARAHVCRRHLGQPAGRRDARGQPLCSRRRRSPSGVMAPKTLYGSIFA